jgi:hypothetical protein
MTWVFVVFICVLFGATAFIVWRKWIAPWRQVEEVIIKSVAANGREHF